MFATCFYNRALRIIKVHGQAAVLSLVFGAALTTPVQPAAAATNILVNDTWKDTSRNDTGATLIENNGFAGTDADADGDIESSWYLGTGMGPPQVSTLSIVGTPGGATPPAAVNGSPNLMQLKFFDGTQTSSASMTSYFTPESTPVNLAATGDSIKVTWNFSLTNVNSSNGSQNLRIGLIDSPSASRVSTNQSPGAGDYTGYAMFLNMGQTLGHGNSFRLQRRTGTAGSPNGNFLGTTSAWTPIGTTGAVNGSEGYDAATPYTFTWQITRNESAGLDHVVRMQGGTLGNTATDTDNMAEVIFTDATPLDATTNLFGGFTFDTFGVRPSGATTTAEIFDTSLFKVEYTTSSGPPVLNGDFNNDGKVDAIDYAVWRENKDTNNSLPNSNNLPGPIGAAHYDLWKANFGLPASGVGSAIGTAAVPEPATFVPLLLAMLGVFGARRRS